MAKCIWSTWTHSKLRSSQHSTLILTCSSSCSHVEIQLPDRESDSTPTRSEIHSGATQLRLESSFTVSRIITDRKWMLWWDKLSWREAITMLLQSIGEQAQTLCEWIESIKLELIWINKNLFNSNYITARNRVGAVGTTVARFVNFLVSNGFTAFNRVIIAGHSLGAHIAGHTGKRTTARMAAIFGMDPAGPLFDMANAADRLAPTDANYVEMLATNAGLLGFDQPIGSAWVNEQLKLFFTNFIFSSISSFYPNWGSTQVLKNQIE